MPEFVERIHVLFSREQLKRLKKEASTRNKSLGELIRTAVEETYFKQSVKNDRLAAAAKIGSMSLPVDDWEKIEAELLKIRSGGAG